VDAVVIDEGGKLTQIYSALNLQSNVVVTSGGSLQVPVGNSQVAGFGTMKINTAGTPAAPDLLFTGNCYLNTDGNGNLFLGHFVAGTTNDYMLYIQANNALVVDTTNLAVLGNQYIGNGGNARTYISNSTGSLSFAVTNHAPAAAEIGANGSGAMIWLSNTVLYISYATNSSVTTTPFVVRAN